MIGPKFKYGDLVRIDDSFFSGEAKVVGYIKKRRGYLWWKNFYYTYMVELTLDGILTPAMVDENQITLVTKLKSIK